MRSLLSFFLLHVAVLLLEAQMKPVDDPGSMLRQLESQSAQVESIHAHFTQVKHLDFLDESIESQGQFWFRRENSLRWAYETPFEYAIVIHQGSFHIKDGDKLSSYDIDSNPAFREINALIVGMVSGQLLHSERFGLHMEEDSQRLLVKLEPLEAQLKEVIAEMEIYFSKSDWMAEEIVMRESEADYTQIRFSQRSSNEVLPDAIFSVDQ